MPDTPASAPSIVRVAIDRPLDRLFDYRSPPDRDVRPGMRVRVPFGPTRLTGVVMEAGVTSAGGFLFGLWLGTLLVVVSATVGAIAIFLIAKTSLGEGLRERAGPWLKRMQVGFNENAISYLLFLRLIPAFPFWIVNIVPALLNMKLKDYAFATFFGIMPGSFVYASVGNGLGAVIEAGDEPDLGIIFQPAILIPILGLAALAILPVVYRKVQAQRRVD